MQKLSLFDWLDAIAPDRLDTCRRFVRVAIRAGLTFARIDDFTAFLVIVPRGSCLEVDDKDVRAVAAIERQVYVFRSHNVIFVRYYKLKLIKIPCAVNGREGFDDTAEILP